MKIDNFFAELKRGKVSAWSVFFWAGGCLLGGVWGPLLPGCCAQTLRRYAEADQVFARAVAVTQDPTDEQITQAYNSVVWKGDLAPLRAALGSLTAGSDDYSGNAWSFFLLGWLSRDYLAAIKTAQTDTATNWTGASNEIFPRQLYLAWAYQAAGDNTQAQPVYAEIRTQMQAALQQRPDDPDLHLALGFAAAGLGLKDEAIREGRKATALMPVSRDAYSGPAYLGYLAQLFVRLGENSQALDTLRQHCWRCHPVASPFHPRCSSSIRSGIRCARIRAFRS